MLHSIVLTLKYSIFGLIIVPCILTFFAGFITQGILVYEQIKAKQKVES